MMKIKNIILMMVAMVLLPVSCIEDSMDKSATGEGMVPINLTINPKAVSTRTATTDIQSAQLASGQTFYAYFTSADVVPRSSTFTADGAGGTTPASQPYFKLSETSTGVRAYYPSSVTEATTSFTVEANQSGDDAYRASDLMFASANITKVFPASTGALTFAHKMAKIKVTTTTRVSSIKTIKLKGILPTVPFNASGGTLGTASGSATDITMYSHSGQTADINCVALIPPQSKAADATLIEVTSALHSSTPLTYKLPNAITFQSGLQYIFNVDLHEEQLVVTCTVAPWSSTTNNSAEVNIADPGVELSSPIIQPNWVIADNGMAYESKTIAELHNHTPVALIYATGSSASGNASYTHGIAIALKDAGDGTQYQYYTSNSGNCATVQSSNQSTLRNDKSGVASTAKLVSDGHTHAAAMAANNHTPSISGAKWFLPSSGQWYDFIIWCNGGSNVVTWGWNNNSTSLNNVTNKLIGAGGDGLVHDETLDYWSSTEYSSDRAMFAGFNNSPSYYIGWENHPKISLEYVRAFLAF